MSRIGRSPEFQFATYYLSRCSENGEPPESLKAESWSTAFALFYQAVGGGRSPSSFQNSMRVSWAVFNAHFGKEPVHLGNDGEVAPLTQSQAEIASEWDPKLEREVEAAALALVTVIEASHTLIQTEINADNGDPESREVGTESRIRAELERRHPYLTTEEIERRAAGILADTKLLARCAVTECRVTYTSAIKLRGRGNVQSGHWLDEVYESALAPLKLPDLTLLVVSKETGKPSGEAFHDGRLKLSGIAETGVKAEQRRAVTFKGYEELFGVLEQIPSEFRHSRVIASALMEQEEGIERAVKNALNRINAAGTESTRVAKEYPDSLPPDKLKALARRLMTEQEGRCALTGTPFDESSEVDRVSLDRLNNDRGYAEGNVHLTTIFANRARGTLPVEEARARLIQWQH
ncbi:MAG: hypothetical protein ABJN35_00070 [Erythrobacter sp.]